MERPEKSSQKHLGKLQKFIWSITDAFDNANVATFHGTHLFSTIQNF
jgi:hypothetical protein